MAVATVVLLKIFPQSAKLRLVVMRVDFFSCLALMTWKKRFEPSEPRGRYPISSSYVELHITGLMLSDH